MKIKLLALAGTLTLFALSCSKQNEEALKTPGILCDTTDQHYAVDVVPILEKNCYTCHGTSSNQGSGGIVLQGYIQLKAKADQGILIGVITHSTGFPAMPENAPKLSDCEINIIRSWINNGTQNN